MICCRLKNIIFSQPIYILNANPYQNQSFKYVNNYCCKKYCPTNKSEQFFVPFKLYDCLNILIQYKMHVLYRNIDQTLVNSLQGLLNFEIGGLDCRFFFSPKDCKTRVQCKHMEHLFCNALVHVIYSRVSGQSSYTVR